MTSRRSKLEIYVNILKEIRSGSIKPTKIMYASNLSWKPLQQLLTSLLDQELIVECEPEKGDDRTNKIYGITDRGRSVLEYFGKAEGLIETRKPIEIRNWS